MILQLNKKCGGHIFIKRHFQLYKSAPLSASLVGAGLPAGLLRTPMGENIPPGHFIHH